MNPLRPSSDDSIRLDRGQAETIGVVLILGMTLLGATVALVVGTGAINGARDSAAVENVEHSMTQFDSQAAIVGLGNSEIQTVSMGSSGSGSYSVDEDAGWIRVRHLNFTGTAPAKNETVMNATMGALVFHQGDRRVAYQGGGVWLHRNNGTAMVSPPEFHYRQATLTLPLILTRGSGGVSGQPTAEIRAGDSERVFPNITSVTGNQVGAPYNDTGEQYVNPIGDGTVVIEVNSEFYQGWAEYFRTRTEGNVSVDHANQTARLSLGTVSDPGRVDPLPQEGESIDARGVPNEHSIYQFSVELSQGNNPNNLHFSFWAESGSKKFEIAVQAPPGTGQDCVDGTLNTSYLVVDVYYDNGTGPSYQGWTNDTIPAATGPISARCEGGDMVITADLTSDIDMTFTETTTKGNPAMTYLSWDGQAHAGSATLEGHSVASEPRSYTTDDNESLDYLVNHYLAKLGPSVDLTVFIGPGGSPRVDPDESEATLKYEATGSQFVTFLHITKNEVVVELR